MRPLAAVLCVLLVVLAGCSAPFSFGGEETTSAGPSSSGAGEAGSSGASGAGGSGAGTATADASAAALADPDDDALGWEGGYWHNESIPVTGADGLNASEQSTFVNRTMARIERVRELEFNDTVPVEVISREAFQGQNATGGGARSPTFRTFDNAKFEGLFLIGENNDSLAVQQSNRNQNVLGYYSPRNDSIVVVSGSATPRISRSTLAHELVHALQDQQFNLSEGTPPTRDGYNARNGLIEGEANYVQRRYEDRCGGQWNCLDVGSAGGGGGGSGGGLHLGVYALEYFPYADGPAFVDAVFDRAGWQGVNALHEDVPESTEQVINPRKYGNDTPTNLTIRNASSAGWERVRPDGRPDYATLGQSALSAMFGYTLYDSYNESPAIPPQAFLNTEGRSVNRTDPFEYGLAYTNGWDGDRMAVYEKNNRTGYVWKLAWDSPGEAREFVRGYRQLLTHWGGERVLGRQGVWEVERSSPFADAFRVSRQGSTVTIVNAPQPSTLNAVHASG
jgi:hypothetical protein